MRPSIEVYSTFAKDIFLTESGKITKEQQGGPATFIEQTLDALEVGYILNTSDTAIVEILLTDKGEYGRIKQVPARKLIKPQQLDSILLISTLLDEWTLPQTSVQIFLDIQGYVRNGEVFGGMKPFIVDPQLESMLTCIKAEQDEAKYLSADFLKRQKNRQLAITKGGEGVELYIAGKRYDIPAIPIPNLPDTVGAGDTWFSAYAAYQALGNDCLLSAEQATIFVAKFLQRKKERKYENKNR